MYWISLLVSPLQPGPHSWKYFCSLGLGSGVIRVDTRKYCQDVHSLGLEVAVDRLGHQPQTHQPQRPRAHRSVNHPKPLSLSSVSTVRLTSGQMFISEKLKIKCKI